MSEHKINMRDDADADDPLGHDPGDDSCGGLAGRRFCDRQMIILSERVGQANRDLADMKKTLDRYVTQHEFSPVKALAYGMAGLILTAVVSALVASVIVK